MNILNSKNDSSLFTEKFDVYSNKTDTEIYPEIWKNFDNRPFIKENSSTNINKIYLLVPYSEKEDAKKMNAKWDKKMVYTK